MTDTLKASTPAAMRDEIVKQAMELSTHYAMKAATAVKAKTRNDNNSRSMAISSFANFIRNLPIETPPRSNKCPNCGEEML